jgi:hypothetical protein
VSAATVLEVMQAGIAAQVAMLEDASLATVPRLSWAAAEGIGEGVIAPVLTRRPLAEIMSRAAAGGPLEGLAAQLSAERAYLQGA